MTAFQHYTVMQDIKEKTGRLPGETWGRVEGSLFDKQYSAHLASYGARLAVVKNTSGPEGLWFDTVEHKTAFAMYLAMCINEYERRKNGQTTR